MHGSLMCEVILGICRNKRWARSEHQAMHKTRREIHCVYRENEVKSDSAAFSSNPFILLLFKFQISTISSYTFNFVFFFFFPFERRNVVLIKKNKEMKSFNVRRRNAHTFLLLLHCWGLCLKKWNLWNDLSGKYSVSRMQVVS